MTLAMPTAGCRDVVIRVHDPLNETSGLVRMLKGTEIIGLPVIMETPGGDERIANWILDTDTGHLVGFLITQGGWRGGARILLWEDVRYLSTRSLKTEQRSPVLEVSRVMNVKRILEDQPQIIGLEVITRHGEHLGTILDFCFDEVSGELLGLITSGRDSQHDDTPAFQGLAGNFRTGDRSGRDRSHLNQSFRIDLDPTLTITGGSIFVPVLERLNIVARFVVITPETLAAIQEVHLP